MALVCQDWQAKQQTKPMQLIDTHVHINFDVFQADLDSVVSRWREAGVVRLVHSCVEPSEFESIKALAARLPELHFSVGLHPLDVEKWTEATEAFQSKIPQITAFNYCRALHLRPHGPLRVYSV